MPPGGPRLTQLRAPDKVSYLPGGLATGSVTYHACFHDLADGLQTHVFAPLGLDIKAKWSVGGSLPGEPRPAAELGLGIPKDGLYIREDVRMKCNIMMLSFVKKTFKDSHGKLVDRLVQKAHILEAKAANDHLANAHHSLAPVLPAPAFDSPQLRPASTFDSVAAPYRHVSLYSTASSGGHSVPSPLQSPALPQHQHQHQQQQQPGPPPGDPRGSFYPGGFKGEPMLDPRMSLAQPGALPPHPAHRYPAAYHDAPAHVAELATPEPQPQQSAGRGAFASELPG